jgi:hypothetical protein
MRAVERKSPSFASAIAGGAFKPTELPIEQPDKSISKDAWHHHTEWHSLGS